MRLKTLLCVAALGLCAAPARAQFVGTTTVVTGGPGVVVGSPVLAPGYGATVVSPYSVVTPAAPVIVRRSTIVAPRVYSPTVLAAPVVPGPVLMSPGVTVVRPGWGYGPAFGPRPWGWRRW